MQQRMTNQTFSYIREGKTAKRASAILYDDYIYGYMCVYLSFLNGKQQRMKKKRNFYGYKDK